MRNALNPTTPQNVNLNANLMRLAGITITSGNLQGNNAAIVENNSATNATLTVQTNSDTNFDGLIRNGTVLACSIDQVRQQHSFAERH